MRYLIIIPTHNEQENIALCLASLNAQTFSNYTVMVVNDGSTDDTQNIVEDFIKDKNQFSLLNLETSKHSPGAKVVNTFYKGLENFNLNEYDVICKFDADIIFPPDYLEKMNEIYEQNPKVGMASGIVKISKSEIKEKNPFDFKNEDNQWSFEDISSKNHIRGPIKSYRKECFTQMNGLKPTLGWDNIDVMLAQMNGWETKTNKNLWVKHLRPTMYKYKNQKAEKLGQYFYNIGLSFPLAVLSAGKSSFKDKSLKSFLVILKTFCSQKGELTLTSEEINYIRKLRWNGIKRSLFG